MSHSGVKSLGPTHNLLLSLAYDTLIQESTIIGPNLLTWDWRPSIITSKSEPLLHQVNFSTRRFVEIRIKNWPPAICRLAVLQVIKIQVRRRVGIEVRPGWSERLTYNAGAVPLLGGRSRRIRRAKVLINLATFELESAVTWERVFLFVKFCCELAWGRLLRYAGVVRFLFLVGYLNNILNGVQVGVESGPKNITYTIKTLGQYHHNWGTYVCILGINTHALSLIITAGPIFNPTFVHVCLCNTNFPKTKI